MQYVWWHDACLLALLTRLDVVVNVGAPPAKLGHPGDVPHVHGGVGDGGSAFRVGNLTGESL